MKTKKLSGGQPRAAQVMLLLFFIPFASFLSYIIFSKNFTVEGILVLSVFLLAISLVLKFGFSYADVYLSRNTIVIRKLFIKKEISLQNIEEINKSFLPFTYYIKVGKSKISFLPNASDLSKHLLSLDSNKALELIKEKFVKED
ncbi:hypothetical protein ACFQRK_23495 [Parapedobacter sp. GCM10030251]|uniref:hypothetical protein n=1 Tax=Parapedobacter sp. GCM10030251 TaxID=3273419 RepID=UPI00361C3930